MADPRSVSMEMSESMADQVRALDVWRPSYYRVVAGCFVYLLGVILVPATFVTYAGGLFGVVGLGLVGLGTKLYQSRWYYVGKGVGSVTGAGLSLDMDTILSRDLVSRAWLIPRCDDQEADAGSLVVLQCVGLHRPVIFKGSRKCTERLIDYLESAGIRIAIPVSRRWAAFLPPFWFVFLLAGIPALLFSGPTNLAPLFLPVLPIVLRLWLWRERFDIAQIKDGFVQIGSEAKLPLTSIDAVEVARTGVSISLTSGVRCRVWTRGWSACPCLPLQVSSADQAVAVRSLIERARTVSCTRRAG